MDEMSHSSAQKEMDIELVKCVRLFSEMKVKKRVKKGLKK